MQATSTVLIIDDEPIARAGLEALLAGEGYRLEFATNGQEGLAMASELVPDVILLDIMMPDMDGYEVCRRLRDTPRLRSIPIIIISALSDKESLVRGLDAGGDEFLSKPVTGLELRPGPFHVTNPKAAQGATTVTAMAGAVRQHAGARYAHPVAGDHELRRSAAERRAVG